MGLAFIRLPTLVAAAVLLPGIAGCVAASAAPGAWTGDAAYAWAPGTTLRYRLTTESSGATGMELPRFLERRRIRIALTPTGDGQATARIEEARREIAGTDPGVRTAGADVTGQPFMLAVGRLGIDSIVGAAGLPLEWSDVVSDLGSLLPRLPGGALPAGRTWGDAKRFDLSTDTAWAEPQTRSVSYRVVGDSTIRGAPVVVVAYEGRRTREVRHRGPPPPPPPGVMFLPSVVLTVAEDEEGRFYFDARSGRLVRLTRTVEVLRRSPSYTNAEAATQEETHRQTLELLSATAGR